MNYLFLKTQKNRERKKSPHLGGFFSDWIFLRKPLSHARIVGCPIVDRLVAIDVAVPDLDVEVTIRIAAHPGFVMYRRSLASEI
uniref:Uncharacterized protein n=1 Tax=uncultured marine microorganism HF4000_137B17 TaxID=455523 RepID=B3T271_9ZZZZ|nr:hypothetical protein ALOHA_HF4000137B17ctg1g17 [uncultured marine microorganism HF4000_137B17]